VLRTNATNACVNSCVNSPEDGPVGLKHVEIRQYMNKIEIVTSVGFSFHMLKGYMVQKLKIHITIFKHLTSHSTSCVKIPLLSVMNNMPEEFKKSKMIRE
jgi:hypothetical protein